VAVEVVVLVELVELVVVVLVQPQLHQIMLWLAQSILVAVVAVVLTETLETALLVAPVS
jgi:hypothetical protein